MCLLLSLFYVIQKSIDFIQQFSAQIISNQTNSEEFRSNATDLKQFSFVLSRNDRVYAKLYGWKTRNSKVSNAFWMRQFSDPSFRTRQIIENNSLHTVRMLPVCYTNVQSPFNVHCTFHNDIQRKWKIVDSIHRMCHIVDTYYLCGQCVSFSPCRYLFIETVIVDVIRTIDGA